MVAVKAADVDAFVARPDPSRPVVLVFGPDAGLVSERVNMLVKASVDDVNDPFSLVRLGGEEFVPKPDAPGGGATAHSVVRRPPRRVGQGRQPQYRTRGRGSARLAVERMP